jgi:4-amino-4-deoxy-L-arabinose transferase-like glycosyltransferase
VLLSGLTGGLLFLLARRFSNGTVALVAWFIWLIAPAALRFRPSYFSEVTTSAIWLVAWWTLLRYRETGGRRWLVMLAALVAWGGITRPVTMIAFAIPVGLVVAWTVWKRRAWGDVVASLPLALAICAIVPVWSHSVLGGWGKNPYAYYQTLYFPVENPGLGIDSTPPLRALPADMEKFNDYARRMHAIHTAELRPKVLEARLAELGDGMWRDQYFLYLLAIVGALVMPLPVAMALGTCALVVIGYLGIAHQPFWVIYYLELPVPGVSLGARAVAVRYVGCGACPASCEPRAGARAAGGRDVRDVRPLVRARCGRVVLPLARAARDSAAVSRVVPATAGKDSGPQGDGIRALRA